MSDYVIETKQLCKTYGAITALDHVDIHVKRGSIYGLIGDNGAGKSTLLKILAGHCFASWGEVSLFGKYGDKELENCRRQTGILIEQTGFYPTMRVEHMLEYTRIQKGIPGKEKVEEILRLTGIWEKRKSKCKDLSLGMKQRLGLAIALLGEPQILLLDEPINGLDPSGIIELRNLFQRLNEEKNITILLSSHILSELQQVATTFGFLSRGVLLEEISAPKLFEKCTNYLDMEVTDVEAYAALLTKYLPQETFKILPNATIQILNPQSDTTIYSRIAMEHNLYITRMEKHHTSLEDYYVNLKKAGGAAC